jgi:hypothetical protein
MTLKELGPNYRSSLGAGHRMTWAIGKYVRLYFLKTDMPIYIPSRMVFQCDGISLPLRDGVYTTWMWVDLYNYLDQKMILYDFLRVGYKKYIPF